MTRRRSQHVARLAGIVAASGIGVAGLIWPAVDRALLAAVTVALLGGSLAVLGYVGWTGWAELLRGHRRPDAGGRERARR